MFYYVLARFRYALLRFIVFYQRDIIIDNIIFRGNRVVPMSSRTIALSTRYFDESIRAS